VVGQHSGTAPVNITADVSASTDTDATGICPRRLGYGQQQLTATLPITSPGSTVDLTIYQTGQPVGSELFVDDVTEQSLV
jgi:hypothetical protein